MAGFVMCACLGSQPIQFAGLNVLLHLPVPGLSIVFLKPAAKTCQLFGR